MKKESLFLKKIKFKDISIYLLKDETTLLGIYFKKPRGTFLKKDPLFKKEVKQLGEYFQGKRKKFSIRLEIEGTKFQKKILNALRKIPYGKTRPYSGIARTVGSPKAARAVGSACRMNPFPILIPCHRVVSKSGIGGYSGGLRIKKRLLSLESRKHKYL